MPAPAAEAAAVAEVELEAEVEAATATAAAEELSPTHSQTCSKPAAGVNTAKARQASSTVRPRPATESPSPCSRESRRHPSAVRPLNSILEGQPSIRTRSSTTT